VHKAKYPANDRLPEDVSSFFIGTVIFSLLSTVIEFLGKQEICHKYGISAELWAVVFGYVIGNSYVLFSANGLPRALRFASQGEFYIKIGLVLLGVDIKTIGELGVGGFLLCWVCTPLVILISYFIGAKIFNMDRKLVAMMSAGLAVCGTSASTAVKSAIRGDDGHLSICISVLTIFTTVQMIAIPYLAKLARIPLLIGAAWLGSSIDGTAQVVVSAEIFDDRAIPIASTTKMIQNCIIGFVALFFSVYWVKVQERGGRTGSCMDIWTHFPKFVLGFLMASGIISIVNHTWEESKAETFVALVVSSSRWFFTLGFLGVGMITNLKQLGGEILKGKAIYLYMIGQLFDLGIKLGASWIIFGIIWKQIPY